MPSFVVTQKFLKETSNIFKFKVLYNPENQGYGYGILAGLRSCVSPYLAWTHADMQTDPADVVRGRTLRKYQESTAAFRQR